MTEPIQGIESLPLGSLKRYLLASGWRRHPLPNNLDLFSLADDEDIEIVLPSTSRAQDLFRRLEDAVFTLSALERRKSHDVIDAIRAVSYDLVRSRLPESAIRHDTIKLGVAEEFIKRMAKVLAATAHGELHTGPYFERISSTAMLFASDCRFGHTFRGSFGFTVESPVGPNTIAPREIASAPPLERRAIVRLARGLRVVQGAIEAKDPTGIVNSYDKGLNANACEDLAAMVEMPQVGEIAFDISFSPEWSVPEDVGTRPYAKIGRVQGVEVLREAAKALRVVNYEKQRTIIGKVRTLHSMEETPAELFTISGLQDIIVEWDSEELGTRLIRVSLGPEDYLRAMEAHKTGRTVTVFGELERRPWRLENARDFRVI